MILGVDIGGVIIQRTTAADKDTSFFSEHFLASPAVPGAFEALALLRGFFSAIHLVSKCGAQVQDKTLAWLTHHGFHETTGIPREQVHFCRTREGKAPICADLGLSHFVDDRLEVLSYLPHVTHRYLFCPREAEVARFASYLHGVVRVESWAQLVSQMSEGGLLLDQVSSQPTSPRPQFPACERPCPACGRQLAVRPSGRAVALDLVPTALERTRPSSNLRHVAERIASATRSISGADAEARAAVVTECYLKQMLRDLFHISNVDGEKL